MKPTLTERDAALLRRTVAVILACCGLTGCIHARVGTVVIESQTAICWFDNDPVPGDLVVMSTQDGSTAGWCHDAGKIAVQDAHGYPVIVLGRVATPEKVANR